MNPNDQPAAAPLGFPSTEPRVPAHGDVTLHVTVSSHTFFNYAADVCLLPTKRNAYDVSDSGTLPPGVYSLFPCAYLAPLHLPFYAYVLFPKGQKPPRTRVRSEVPEIEPYGYAFTNVQGCNVHNSYLSYSPIKAESVGNQFIRRAVPLAFRNEGLVVFHAPGVSTILVSPVISQSLSDKITSL